MFDRIIVPLDGSAESEIVLPYVAAVATAFSNDVVLVSAAEQDTSEKSQQIESYLKHTAEELKSNIKKQPALNITTSLLKGKPADEILKYAAQKKADLIIIAGHGASGGNSKLMGNIATKILSASNRPVLLVKTKDIRGTAPSGLIKRILVPLDGSEMSEGALKTIEPMAAALGAEIVLFQAVEPVRYVPGFETMVPNVVLPSDDEIKRSASNYLNGVEKPLKQRGIRTSSVIIADAPAEAIIDYADSGNIDMIAMTTHGFSGIKRWVFGSTTEKVLQAGSRPVLLIPISKT
ncbi:MAG: universal stress protein [Dehalococcoidia bacterium]|nr:MAG: universal stress protein [Dehalococcoidia bacterium]